MSGTPQQLRASQLEIEVLVSNPSPTYRVSQLLLGALTTNPSPAYRATQLSTTSLVSNPSPTYRATQLSTTSLVSNPSPTYRASQIAAVSIVSNPYPVFRVSQFSVTCLVGSKELNMPGIFPELLLGFSVIKRPIGNWGLAQATSGAEVRVNYWSAPLWEWDLTYEYLPDTNERAGVTASDLKTLMGFYTYTSCGFAPFYFNDVDDNSVRSQPLGTGDGTTTSFTLIRTFGINGYTTSDNVGSVNIDGPVGFVLYVDGIAQSQNTYRLVNTIPMNNYVVFNTPPASGAVITCDMSYYYYVRFANPEYDFEKFMDKLWSVKKITLRSLRS